MLPGKLDLVFYRGDSRLLKLRFDQVPQQGNIPPIPYNLTGLVWASQIRYDYDDPAVLGSFTVTVTQPTEGKLQLLLPASIASTLIEKGVWDLQSTDPSNGNFVQTWLTGKVTVLPDVTRQGA